MSKVRVGGAWRQPTVTRVKIAGVWRQVALAYVKVGGVWKVSTFAGPPAAPVLAYTAENQFTISNYDAALTYVVAGATRAGAVLTGVSDGATVKVAYSVGSPESAPSTMRVAAHARVLDSIASSPSSAGCGPRGFVACPPGTISNPDGTAGCAGPGTQGDFCGGACPGDCFGNFCTCWNWHWTDYSGSGYTLIGNVWGKAVNG
jgi:hypothetical protein